MKLRMTKLSVAVLSVLFSGAASAADMQASGGTYQGTDHQNNANGVINAGGFEIKPTLGLAIGKNDNVGLANNGTPKTNSNFTKLSPKISFAMPTHGNEYSATYSGEYANYTSSSQDNYDNHNFDLQAKNDWSTRVNTLINADYIKGHNGRNALPTGNISKELWHSTGVKGMLHYGAQGAQGQFELTGGQESIRYDTNVSGNTQNMAYDTTPLQGTFFYKVAPATKMFFQAGTASYRYAAATAKQWDSKEQQYMVGVKWEATAKTTGSVKVGRVSKSFNSGLFSSFSAPTWDARVIWSPLTYSNVNFALSQNAAESYNVGSAMISRDANVDWNHEWSSHIKSKLNLDNGTDTFQGISQVNKRQNYGAKLSYTVNRWLDAGVEFQNTKRTSTNALYSYTQSVTMLVLDGTL